MTKPVAAGKSSFDLVDRETLFSLLGTEENTVYLDMACGAGRYSLALAERIEDAGTIYAVDLWEEGGRSLKRAATDAGLRSIKPLLADIAGPLPLETDSADACLMATILHDLTAGQQDAAVAEAARILKPGGSLVVVEFKKIDHGPGPRMDIRLSKDDVARLAARHGFTHERTDSAGEYVNLLRFGAK